MAKSRNRPNHFRRVEKRKRDQAFKKVVKDVATESGQLRLLYTRMRLILLGVLGQLGGEVTVTTGTIDQIGERIDDFDYAILEGKAPNESIVKLIDRQADEQKPLPAAPALTIQRIADDPSDDQPPAGVDLAQENP